MALRVAIGGVVFALVLGPTASAHDSITAIWSAGVLNVVGDGANDAVTITCEGGDLKVNGIDPAGGPAPCSATHSFTIQVGPGDDSVSMEAVGKVDFPFDVSVFVGGGPGNDSLTGSAFSDSIEGGTAHDSINAGPGTNDLLIGGEGDDILNGGSEGAEVREFGDVNFLLTNTTLSGVGTDTLIGINRVELTGGPSDNVIDASAFDGYVSLSGLGGNDLLLSGRSGSGMFGGPGSDHLVGGRGRDRLIIGGTGADRIEAGGRNDAISGRNGRDTLRGEGGNDDITGGKGSDVLNGGSGGDKLSGGKGLDRLHGGPGQDQESQ